MMKRGDYQIDGLETLETVQHVVFASSGVSVGFPGTILFPTNTTNNNVHSTTLVRTFLRIGMRTEGKGS